MTNKLQVFVNKSLRKLLGIHWPERITNEELLDRTEVAPVWKIILERKWKWIGHTLRKGNSITKEALEWTPQGKRKRGRPITTWRRSILKEAKTINKTWEELKKDAQNRVRWRSLVAALCSLRNEEDK